MGDEDISQSKYLIYGVEHVIISLGYFAVFCVSFSLAIFEKCFPNAFIVFQRKMLVLICIEQFARFIQHLLIGVFDIIPNINYTDVGVLEYLIEGLDFISYIMIFLVFFTLCVYWWEQYLRYTNQIIFTPFKAAVVGEKTGEESSGASGSKDVILEPSSPTTPSTPMLNRKMFDNLSLKNEPNEPNNKAKDMKKKKRGKDMLRNILIKQQMRTMSKEMRKTEKEEKKKEKRKIFNLKREMNFFYYLVCFLLLLITMLLFIVCIFSPLTPNSVIYKCIRLVYRSVIDGVVIVFLLLVGIKLFLMYRKKFKSVPDLKHLQKAALITVGSTSFYLLLIFANFFCFIYGCVAYMDSKSKMCYFKYDDVLISVNAVLEILISVFLIILILPTPRKIRERIQIFSHNPQTIREQYEEDLLRSEDLIPTQEALEDREMDLLETPGTSLVHDPRDYFG